MGLYIRKIGEPKYAYCVLEIYFCLKHNAFKAYMIINKEMQTLWRSGWCDGQMAQVRGYVSVMLNIV